MKIKVVKKSSGVKVDSICPWVIDVPPEKSRS